MKIAVISDTHGNVIALDSVLAEIDRTGPFDAVLMGGDVAYGGPQPAECIERIIARGYPTVRGNTDQMILDAVSGSGDAHANWVLDQIDEEMLAFLQSLPVQQNLDAESGSSLGLVHATPWSVWDSVLPTHGDMEFRRMLFESGVDLLAYGHIHIQHQRNLDTGQVVAVGSVGLPFDGDRRAMYTVLESGTSGWRVDFCRLEYDFEKAVDAARRNGGPNGEMFASSLVSAQRPG